MDLPPAGASHDEREIEAVIRVLKENPTLDLGNEVLNLETRIADLLAKSHGVMVNSGSSALRLAIDLLRLQPGYKKRGSKIAICQQHRYGACQDRKR